MNPPIVSPCRRICRIGDDHRCDGCGRTLGEVGAWLGLSDRARRIVMDRVADWVPRDDQPATTSIERPR